MAPLSFTPQEGIPCRCSTFILLFLSFILSLLKVVFPLDITAFLSPLLFIIYQQVNDTITGVD